MPEELTSNPENQVVYPGSIWKTSLRVKKGIGRRMSVGLAYAKGCRRKGSVGISVPNICVAYLEWKGKRIVEQLILGSYRLNNGMGLTQGAGLMHAPPAFIPGLCFSLPLNPMPEPANPSFTRVLPAN